MKYDLDANLIVGCLTAVLIFATLVIGIIEFNKLPYPTAIDKCAHSSVVTQNSGFCMEVAKQKQ